MLRLLDGGCCAGRPGTYSRFAGALAAVLPGALAVVVPKCPLCLAAWVLATTGLPVRGEWVQGGVLLAGLATGYAIRRRSGAAGRQ